MRAVTHRGLQAATATAALLLVACAPLVALVVSVVAGGGPGAESADDALLTLAARDAARGLAALGPYSRFGWHHPGPSYLYLLAVPTWVWHGGPTGTWVGATLVALAATAGIVWTAQRLGGGAVGWWAAAGVLAVVAGLGPGLLRDPWNPYVVVLPVLFVGVACGFAAAGARGALIWAAVVASFAVQTHVSTGPALGGMLAVAAAVQLGRRSWRRWRRRPGPKREAPPAGAPPALPDRGDAAPLRDAAPLPPAGPWWRYRPGMAVAVMVLVAQWAGPVFDQVAGTGNLSRLLTFFSARHAGPGWGAAWKLVTAMVGVTLFQHHAALRDGVSDPHPAVTTAAFVALALVAIVTGVARRRPAAVWMGLFSLLGALLVLESVTRVAGYPYRYLVVWVSVLPVLPLVGVALACRGMWPSAHAWWARGGRIGPAVAATVVMSVLALRGVARATPAVALTDRDVLSVWALVAPAVGPGHDRVRVEIAAPNRWPAAAGLALELERHGHPARVEPLWVFAFGTSREASGREAVAVVVAGSDARLWPAPSEATLLGQAGPDVVFVRRGGRACWWGWLPFGGPACPPPVAPSGPPPHPAPSA